MVVMKADPRLAKKILVRIDREERRKLTAKAAAFGAVLAGSVGMTVFGAMDMAAGLSHSGFYSFVSLLFSDFSLAMANFSDFVFSLAASFPIFAAVFLLAGIFAAVWSVAGFIDEVRLTRRRTFHSLT